MRWMVLAGLLVAACGGEDDAPAAPPAPVQPSMCEQPNGLYRLSYRAQSGDCGPIPDSVIALPPSGGTMMGPACEGRQTFSADNCTIESDLRCVGDSGSLMIIRGKVTWNRSATSASGTAYIEWTLGRDFCTGIYGLTYRKL